MEITIGVKHAPRELTLESDQPIEKVRAAVDEAIEKGNPLVLADDKGREVVVPADSLAYVEIDAVKEQRRVGIGLV